MTASEVEIFVKKLDTADLQKAVDGSYYFIAGAGGSLADWVIGYQDLMATAGIGKPTAWFSCLGEQINRFAGADIVANDQFQPDLTCLLFPLEGLNVGALAMFKLRMQDRWFDDVINNMRRK